MRENREVPALENVVIPGLEPQKETALQAVKNKKHGKKGALKGTNQKSAAVTRNMGARNARQMPTRQMNNRGGR